MGSENNRDLYSSKLMLLKNYFHLSSFISDSSAIYLGNEA